MIIGRLGRIALETSGLAVWWLLLRLRLARPALTPPQRLCRTLERLGATFVKFGQALSLRRDLLSDDDADALQALQDDVRPFRASRR